MDILENKVDIIDNKVEFSNPINKESNVAFPIPSIAELRYFEEQLQEIELKNEVVSYHKFFTFLLFYYTTCINNICINTHITY